MISKQSHLQSLLSWHNKQAELKPSQDAARKRVESEIQYLDEFQSYELLVEELKSADGSSADKNTNPGEVEIRSRANNLSAIRKADKSLTKQGDDILLEVKEDIGSSRPGLERSRTTTYSHPEEGIIAVDRRTDAPDGSSSSVSFLLDTSQGLLFSNQPPASQGQ